MQVNLEYASKAVDALLRYESIGSRPGVKARFRHLGFDGDDIGNLLASLMHLAQQLKNEGEDIDVRVLWESAWNNFEKEVLIPDDIELGQREVAADNEA